MRPFRRSQILNDFLTIVPSMLVGGAIGLIFGYPIEGIIVGNLAALAYLIWQRMVPYR